ncbi:diaminopimelate decarboxylase [Thermoplasma sp.]|uniref:diaminopimelate decarboxylase n=1 Tax=Thermoplasma sp. TaxID=1973142 RepID=UPI00262A3DAC|nr:diaminopimelate decarboxylase [Thermoplasma sp.]
MGVFDIFDNGSRSTISGISLNRIADIYGTPVIVYSARRIRDNFTRLKKAFPEASIFYSVKANDNPRIIELLGGMGSGADTASPFEISMSIFAGIDTGNMLYSPNNASLRDLEFAYDRGITINFNSFTQYSKMRGKMERISFRINPGFGLGEFGGITTGGSNTKFGLDPDSAILAYEKAREDGSSEFGIHMMIGSNNRNHLQLYEAYSSFFKVADRISKEAGVKFEFVDIGGGLGIPYSSADKDLDIASLGSMTTDEFSRHGFGHLVLEPGRYIVGDAGIIIGTVNDVHNGFVGTDIGMNINIRPALYGARHMILPLSERTEGEEMTVTGQICENTDRIGQIAYRVMEGDRLMVLCAGAYIYSMSSRYNGRPRPAEAMIMEDGTDRLIRRREDFSDFLSAVV